MLANIRACDTKHRAAMWALRTKVWPSHTVEIFAQFLPLHKNQRKYKQRTSSKQTTKQIKQTNQTTTNKYQLTASSNRHKSSYIKVTFCAHKFLSSWKPDKTIASAESRKQQADSKKQQATPNKQQETPASNSNMTALGLVLLSMMGKCRVLESLSYRVCRVEKLSHLVATSAPRLFLHAHSPAISVRWALSWYKIYIHTYVHRALIADV